jgi:hypothetical protein
MGDLAADIGSRQHDAAEDDAKRVQPAEKATMIAVKP